MKRFALLTFVPLALFALERVNLIKDSGFEKDSDVWHLSSGGSDVLDSAIVKRHDNEKSWGGSFSASSDNRTPPGNPIVNYYDSAKVTQNISQPKAVGDLDSLTLHYLTMPVESEFTLAMVAYIGLYLDSNSTSRWVPVYFIKAPNIQDPTMPLPYLLLDAFDFPLDTSWFFLKKNIRLDLVTLGVSQNTQVDSFFLVGYGKYSPPWRGQKVYWDAIRLTGYADYDVGVKEILSGDSVWAGVYYKPVARIKNFGREAADDFLAIAEIRQGEDLVWADTVPYTLPADTEDTLEFDSFPIPNALSYTLTVRTVMEPDESDEDDALSQWIAIIGVNEQAASTPATLEVSSLSANPRISYSLPDGQSGVLRVYDASGRKVKSLKVQGSGEVEFSAQSSGVYFVWLEAGSSAITRKAVIK